MTEAAFETLLKRDRVVMLGALGVIAVLAWTYTAWLAQHMAMSNMPSASMSMRTMAPAPHAWAGGDFAATFAMWSVMMIGMMTPSAAPMILIYARVAREARSRGHVFATTAWFAGGYLLAWLAFSALATVAQGGLAGAALITPMLSSASRWFGAGLLIAAGIYQWTPLKDACLAHCRAPLDFIMHHGGFRPEAHRALWLGARHGIYCVLCCWALMALLFVGGVMNVLWIAAIAFFVLLERLLPGGRIVARIGGAALITAGAWLALAPSIG